MSWPVRALLGPMLWAVAFAGVYALHGLGCALDWPRVITPLGPLHQLVLRAAWLAAVAAAGLIVWLNPVLPGREGQIVRLGGWTGLAAILLSLFPVLGVTSCG